MLVVPPCHSRKPVTGQRDIANLIVAMLDLPPPAAAGLPGPVVPANPCGREPSHQAGRIGTIHADVEDASAVTDLPRISTRPQAAGRVLSRPREPAWVGTKVARTGSRITALVFVVRLGFALLSWPLTLSISPFAFLDRRQLRYRYNDHAERSRRDTYASLYNCPMLHE